MTSEREANPDSSDGGTAAMTGTCATDMTVTLHRSGSAKEPSVDAPVALFFGAGTLYNRDNREFLVKAFPMNVRFDSNRVHLACYFPMPFRKSARIEISGYTNAVTWAARYDALADPFEQVTYFHATYRDHPEPEKGKDMVLLDTRETEGGGDWSGNFVGTSCQA